MKTTMVNPMNPIFIVISLWYSFKLNPFFSVSWSDIIGIWGVNLAYIPDEIILISCEDLRCIVALYEYAIDEYVCKQYLEFKARET